MDHARGARARPRPQAGRAPGPPPPTPRRRLRDSSNRISIVCKSPKPTGRRAAPLRPVEYSDVRTLKHPTREEIQLTDVFHALSDPTRLAIVRGLDDVHEQSCSGLSIPMAKS